MDFRLLASQMAPSNSALLCAEHPNLPLCRGVSRGIVCLAQSVGNLSTTVKRGACNATTCRVIASPPSSDAALGCTVVYRRLHRGIAFMRCHWYVRWCAWIHQQMYILQEGKESHVGAGKDG